MELNAAENDLFTAYVSSFTPLAGDRRTAALLAETIRGIIASEPLCCSRIAAFSPLRSLPRGTLRSGFAGWCMANDDPLPLRRR